MANENIIQRKTDEIPPERLISKFIHLMSEGINHHQVKCNDVVITIEYSDEPRDDIDTCTLYMTRDELSLHGISYFKFFYRVAGILISKGILKLTPSIQQTIAYMYPSYAEMDVIKRTKFAYKCVSYGYAYQMQAFSGPLNSYIPKKELPDETDETYDEISDYNTRIQTIRSYCRHVESEANKRVKDNSIKVSRSVSEISHIGTGNSRRKRDIKKDNNKCRTCLDMLTKLLHISPLQYEYNRRLDRLIDALDGDKRLFETSYTETTIKKDTTTNENGEEITISIPKEKKITLPKDHAETVIRLYQTYVPFLKRYRSLMDHTNSMIEINRYTSIIEKICFHGYPLSKTSYVPRSITEADIASFEESLVDRSVENNVKDTCRKKGLLTANAWNAIRKSDERGSSK